MTSPGIPDRVMLNLVVLMIMSIAIRVKEQVLFRKKLKKVWLPLYHMMMID